MTFPLPNHCCIPPPQIELHTQPQSPFTGTSVTVSAIGQFFFVHFEIYCFVILFSSNLCFKPLDNFNSRIFSFNITWVLIKCLIVGCGSCMHAVFYVISETACVWLHVFVHMCGLSVPTCMCA